MNSLLAVVLASAGVLTVAYVFYGRLLSRLLKLDDANPTPAVEQRDDVDFVPIEPKFLLSQHFSAIAAAGPIVGPILAGAAFGWAPALIWILVGSIFIGGVHDMTALVASIRHRARSIPDVVREHVSYRAYLLFLAFVWICLVYIIVAFTDVTAGCFHDVLKLGQPDSTERLAGAESAAEAPSASTGATIEVAGAAIATSSLLYLALPIAMGLLLRYTKLSLNMATLIFVPLIGVSIWAGQFIPFDVATWWGMDDLATRRFWNMSLLAYCFVASIVPVWFLLQPRGHLGGYFMYIALFGGAVGVVLCGKPIQYPAFIGWTSNPALLGLDKAIPQPLFPVLFITIACGACSGFHSIIASGTTSKQLRRETDAKAIGYGSMLLEAMVAVVSLCCVMMLSLSNPADRALLGKSPNYLYAGGLAQFLAVFHIPVKLGIMFGLMAFTTFVYDTLDVCTRLGRYILQEVFHWKSGLGRIVATAVTTAAPLVFLLNQKREGGKIVEAWRVFWNLFGASNQLLAALTLLGVTVWLWRTTSRTWVWFVVGLPAVWMYTTSMWALGSMCRSFSGGFIANPVPYVAGTLFGLGVVLLIEAAIALNKGAEPPTTRRLEPAMA